ncbi:unnamed protein product [Discosporangium mesarthrocarpum]
MDEDDELDEDEFAVAMYLCTRLKEGIPLPDTLPESLIPPSRRGGGM